MDEIQVREKLAEVLRVDDVDDRLWELLKTRNYLCDDFDPNSESDWEELVEEAELLWNIHLHGLPGFNCRGNHRPSLSDQMPQAEHEILSVRSVFSPGEDKRAEVISRYCAALAAWRPDVQCFRDDVLGGSTLTRQQAIEFLTAPGPQFFSLQQYKDWGLPVLGNWGKISSAKKALGVFAGTTITVQIELPDGRHEASFDWKELETQNRHPNGRNRVKSNPKETNTR